MTDITVPTFTPVTRVAVARASRRTTAGRGHRGAAVLTAGALALAAAVALPSLALAEPSSTPAVQTEEDPRPVLSGRDTTVLQLRWDGTQPVFESVSADGTVYNPNRVRFALPSIPDDAVRSKDRNVFQVPPFNSRIDLSWVGKVGERYPAALGWETSTQRGHKIVFEAPPEGIKPDSVRLSLREFTGPSWMELFSYRPGGYEFTRRIISSAHPYHLNYTFKDGNYNLNPTWAFGAPGEYSATFLFYAETVDGKEVVSNPATLDWDVTAGAPKAPPAPTPTPEPSPTPTPTPTPEPSPEPTPEPSPTPEPGTDPSPAPGTQPAPTPGEGGDPAPGTPDPSTGSTPSGPGTPGTSAPAPSGGGRDGSATEGSAPHAPGRAGDDGTAASDGPAPVGAVPGGPTGGFGPGSGVVPAPAVPAAGGLFQAGAADAGMVTLVPGISSPELLAAAGNPGEQMQVPAGELARLSGLEAPAGWPAAGAPGTGGGEWAGQAGQPGQPGAPLGEAGQAAPAGEAAPANGAVAADGAVAEAAPAPWWQPTAQGPAPAWTEKVPVAVRPAAVAVASVNVWAWALSGLALLAGAGFTGLFAARRRDRAEALAAEAGAETGPEGPAAG